MGAVLMGLAGCTSATPRAAPVLPPPSTVTVTMTEAMKVGQMPIPGEAAMDTFSLVCSRPSATVMANFEYAGGEMYKDHMVVVDIGQGNEPGSDWWAAVTDSGAWITNVPARPASGAVWISVSDGDWSGVYWEPPRLDRGKAAVDLATACLRDLPE